MNTFDSRNRNAADILVDLDKLGERSRLTVCGSHKLEAKAVADQLAEQWSEIVELVGFEPRRIVTGCAPGGAEKAARLAAKRVTGKLAAVFHRPDMMHSIRNAEKMMNIMLAKGGDALLILSTGKSTCKNLRACFAEWRKPVHEVEIS